MSNHTPGPWVVGCKLTPNGVYTVNGELIANTHSASRTLRRDEQIAEQDANARLIAAAPETAAERDKLKEVNADLLAALKRVDQSWTEWLPCGPYDESLTTGPIVRIYESTISIWKQIRAAIAKAEGKS